MELKNVKFKHKRNGFIQAVYGSLDEDASFIAVEQTVKRLHELRNEISAMAEKNEDFSDTMAVEMCVEKAQTNEELIVFIHEIARASGRSQPSIVQMIKGIIPPE
jgi:hypothetical protein